MGHQLQPNPTTITSLVARPKSLFLPVQARLVLVATTTNQARATYPMTSNMVQPCPIARQRSGARLSAKCTPFSVSSFESRHLRLTLYALQVCQIFATVFVGGGISQSSEALFWVQTHVWSFYVPLFGTLVNLGLLFWKRHSHPLNFILLSTFTLMEAFTLGVVVAFYDNVIVMQALLITLGVFIGLTLFTLQSKYDFSGMGPFLFGGLIALMMTGLVGVFIPFGKTMDLIYAIGGCLLFSGYIVYDTYNINAKLSPDEFIMGAISLYLECVMS
ncbi:hypothetical protein H2248_004875 [Termitomyces sp. 'cryptogamus']|nr:hypothetical protein H2248_004875 [Termitomyces sp. 'cryptogamus']